MCSTKITKCITTFALATLLWSNYCVAKEPYYKTPPDTINPVMEGVDGMMAPYEFYYGSYALLIGESSYSDTLMSDLGSVVPELTNLGKVLEQQGFEVTTYFDLDNNELQPTIEKFIREYGYQHPQSRILIYFSGHGIARDYVVQKNDGYFVINEHKGYVLPIDTTSPAINTDFVKTALPLSQFVEWAKAIEVKHSLFIFDSCFSGAILNTRSAGNLNKAPLKPPITVTSDEAELPLRQIITAGTDKQEVPAQSKFLQIIVETLAGRRPEADTNGDEYLTSGELYQYLRGVVPQESVRQTPTMGFASDDFSRGDMVFRLPKRETVILAPENASDENNVNLRSIYIGTTDDEQSVAQAYQVDVILNVGAVGCKSNCRDEPVRHYPLVLTMPDKLPPSAVFTNPVLSCSGNCTDNRKLLKKPTLGSDKRTISAEIETGGQPSIWRLTADVKMPTQIGQAVMLDVSTNTIANVELSNLKTIAKVSAPVEVEQSLKEQTLKHAVEAAQSNDKIIRRNARNEIAQIVGNSDGNIAAQIIRGMPSNNYRNKLAVAEALSAVPKGWSTRESISLDILSDEKKLNDPTLKRSIDAALKNFVSYVYYEIGPDGWLTQSGQLHPISLTKPPLTKANEIHEGDKLIAASDVNMRIGPSADSGISKILKDGSCVIVVSDDRGTNPVTIVASSITGAWLRVKETNC